MSNCGAKKTSSLKELYMINSQTYNALLNKLTSLERAEIDRLNTQPNSTGAENLSMPTNSMTEVSQKHNDLQNFEEDQCSSSKVVNSSMAPRIQSRLENDEASRMSSVENDFNSETDVNHDVEKDEQDPILGVNEVPLELESNPRKRKHKMPHLVKLSTGPGILRKKIKDNDEAKDLLKVSENQEKVVADSVQHQPDEQNSNNDEDKATSVVPKGSHQCPICFKWYKNSFTKFRHLTTMHPSAEETKLAWAKKKEKEARNRRKIKLKTKAIKHLNHTTKTVGSASSRINKRGLKRERNEDESEIGEASKKQQLEILEPKGKTTRKRPGITVKKTKLKIPTRNDKSKTVKEVQPLDSDDDVMREDEIQNRKTSIAGVKRSRARADDPNLNKIVRASAPKRKAKEVAKKALQGKKARKSSVNSSKVRKKTEDSDEEDYEDWLK